MTDFVLSSGNTIRPHRSPWGSFPTKSMKLSTGLSSNQIFIGSLVGLDQAASTSFNDCIVKIGTSSGMLAPAAGQIVGIAAETPSSSVPGFNGNPASTSPGQQGSIMVWEACPMVEFKAWTKGGLITSSLVGTQKELSRDTTLNIDLVQVKASSLATPLLPVVITGLIDNSGDSGGAVTFRFVNSTGFLAFYR